MTTALDVVKRNQKSKVCAVQVDKTHDTVQLGSQSLTACLGAKNSESVGLSQGEASFHAFHDLLGLKGCLTSRMKVTQSIHKAHSWKSLAYPEHLENHESYGKLLRVSGAGTSHGDRTNVLDSTPQKRFQIFFFLILFLCVHLHQLMQPQNRPAHSPVGNCASGKPEFPPDHSQGYVEAAMVLVSLSQTR